MNKTGTKKFKQSARPTIKFLNSISNTGSSSQIRIFLPKLIAIFLLASICVYILWRNSTMITEAIQKEIIILQPTQQSTQKKEQNSGVFEYCLLSGDTRYKQEHFEIAKIATEKEYFDYIKSIDITNQTYPTMSLLANKLYSIRFNYPLIISDLSEFEEFRKRDNRTHVWLKPNFILKVLETRQDCKWLFFTDSDAFFYMQNHKVSLSDWFDSTGVSEHTLGYQNVQLALIKNKGVYPHNDRPYYFQIGLNGFDDKYGGGYYNRPWNGDDWACAGSFVVKNAPKGKQFMMDWISGPAKPDEEQTHAFKWFIEHFSYEQGFMNRVVLPIHRAGSAIYPFKDFGDFKGQFLRHIWSDQGSSRAPMIRESLLELLEITPAGKSRK